MLVLTRKPGERIRIGHNIFVTVVECKNGKVRLGIEAPSDVKISREEVAQFFKFETVTGAIGTQTTI